jgi:hypothetical protein
MLITQCIRLRAAVGPSGKKIKDHPNGGVVTPVRSPRLWRTRGYEDGAGRQRGCEGRRGGAIRRSPRTAGLPRWSIPRGQWS